jgi:transcriptional regulator with XRE-family HTH domain
MTPAARHLRTAIAAAVRDGRAAIGWSRDELARRAGVASGTVTMIERCQVNWTVDGAGAVVAALGVTLDLRFQLALAIPRQRDAAHARCVAYVQRRLERDGWIVRREVEIAHGPSHGWIDLLAFHPATRRLLVIEVKTELVDVGVVERALGWYRRAAEGLAREFGWRPASVGSWSLLLATDANDRRIRENAEALAQSFPARAATFPQASGLAMVDPRSRRRAWLIRTRVDGRRSPAPYADYADFVRRTTVGSPPS